MNITFKLAIIIVLINGDLKLLLRSILHKFGKLSMKGKMETHDYYKKTNALLHASLPPSLRDNFTSPVKMKTKSPLNLVFF